MSFRVPVRTTAAQAEQRADASGIRQMGIMRMTNLDLAAHEPGVASLRDVIDQLADAVDRPVCLRGPDGSELAASTGRTVLRALSDTDHPQPHTTGVDVRVASTTLGRLEISHPQLPLLTAAQWEAVDSAVMLVTAILSDGRPAVGSDREEVMGALLSGRLDDRARSYETALGRRWLQRGQGTVVRALAIGTAVNDVQCQAFGHFLSTMRPVPLWFAGVRPDIIFAVGPSVDASVDHAVIDEGARRGIRILGIGTASPTRSATDLGAAADQAVAAAELSASFEEFHPSVDIDRLGGWAMLSAIGADPSWLGVFSPAAQALVAQADDTQRRTIETLLDAGGQVSRACELLFVHRATLYYRLEKMPEVVRTAMADGMQRSTLHLALKLTRVWEASGRI
ncbi:helix-turn-helix domain-containing protein [Microbacterium sp. P01]|uniref:helix-turn-helix domain-containing protein n=1 Tax=unclassified Microbacterium TaxID=2609290 RepID=UPI00366C5AE5